MAVDDINTKILLHLNGTEGSKVFTDESGKVWTVAGNAKITTAQSKFGGASFLPSGGAITTPNHTDFNLSAINFTIDVWLKRSNSLTYPSYFIGQSNAAATDWTFEAGFYDNTNNMYFWYRYDNDFNHYREIKGSTIINHSNWFHYAIVRNGATIKLYYNGALDATYNMGTDSIRTSTTNLAIGRFGDYPNQGWDGGIDEFRLSNVARWTAPFTPSVKEYAPLSANFFQFFDS